MFTLLRGQGSASFEVVLLVGCFLEGLASELLPSSNKKQRHSHDWRKDFPTAMSVDLIFVFVSIQ